MDRPLRVPFNRAVLAGNELRYMKEALASMHISGSGPFTEKAETFLEGLLGVPSVLLTTSCTHALEMSGLLLELEPGDEVIVPSYTFVSTVNAFVLRGVRPVFVDIRPDTLNIDEQQLESAFTPRTRAIVVVHYAGVGCEMDAINAAARERSVPVIEDNAHGLFGKYKNRWLGSMGVMATLSFHETKNFTCGEGGALMVNDPALIERAEFIREKGTNRGQFFRGEVDKYTWVDVGSSYIPSDLLAAFLMAQLECWEETQRKRKRIWAFYNDQLKVWAAEHEVCLPFVPPGCEHPYHMFYLILSTPEQRAELIQGLRARGILSVFHYLPLHLSPMGRRYGYGKGAFPVTERVSERLVRLPFYNDLDEATQADICGAIREISADWTAVKP